MRKYWILILLLLLFFYLRSKARPHQDPEQQTTFEPEAEQAQGLNASLKDHYKDAEPINVIILPVITDPSTPGIGKMIPPTPTPTLPTLAQMPNQLKVKIWETILATAIYKYTDPPHGCNALLIQHGDSSAAITTNYNALADPITWQEADNFSQIFAIRFRINTVATTQFFSRGTTPIGSGNMEPGTFVTNSNNIEDSYVIQINNISKEGKSIEALLNAFDHTRGDKIEIHTTGFIGI